MTPQQAFIIAVLTLIAIGITAAPTIRARNLRANRNDRQRRMHAFDVAARRRRRTR